MTPTIQLNRGRATSEELVTIKQDATRDCQIPCYEERLCGPCKSRDTLNRLIERGKELAE